jgi:dihydroxy-acid dehydratase
VTPEAFEGGPIGLIEDGDEITIDAEKREINVSITDAEFTRRAGVWSAPEPYTDRGTLAKYARLVSSASEGAVTDKYL